MKLPKVLLGAIAVGITVQATSCGKKNDPTPQKSPILTGQKIANPSLDNCPACGLG